MDTTNLSDDQEFKAGGHFSGVQNQGWGQVRLPSRLISSLCCLELSALSLESLTVYDLGFLAMGPGSSFTWHVALAGESTQESNPAAASY